MYIKFVTPHILIYIIEVLFTLNTHYSVEFMGGFTLTIQELGISNINYLQELYECESNIYCI